MLGGALRREGEHRHARLGKAGHAPGGLCRADGDLRQLLGVRSRGHGHVADHEHAVLAVLRGLGDHQHRAAHAGDAGGALDDLQGRAERLAGGGEGAADLAVGIAALDDQAAEVERIEDGLAGHLEGHALLLAELEEELCVFFGLVAGLGIDDGSLVDMLEAQLGRIGEDFLAVADQDDVGKAVGDGAVGRGDGALLEGFREHDALPVGLGTRDNLVNEGHIF